MTPNRQSFTLLAKLLRFSAQPLVHQALCRSPGIYHAHLANLAFVGVDARLGWRLVWRIVDGLKLGGILGSLVLLSVQVRHFPWSINPVIFPGDSL